VDHTENNYVLRWSGFDELKSANEVRDLAPLIMEQLNAAMEIVHGSRQVRFEGVVEFLADGTRHRTLVAEVGEFEIRSRAAATGVAIGPNGKELPPPPPQRSEVQQWAALAETNKDLRDALMHYARPGWFELYKSFECLRDWAGGEPSLEAKNWVPPGDFERLRRTANSLFRHRPGKYEPPKVPMTLKEAREMIGALIQRVFAGGT
jgi:hypothetical protein